MPGSSMVVPLLVKFPGTERVILSILCGDRHSLALTVENELYTWGVRHHWSDGTQDCRRRRYLVPTKLDLKKTLPWGQNTLWFSGLVVAGSIRSLSPNGTTNSLVGPLLLSFILHSHKLLTESRIYICQRAQARHMFVEASLVPTVCLGCARCME
jgi:hypothetical protein